MFASLARMVNRHAWLVIAVWIVAAGGVRLLAPRWDAVTLDGDFAYLPDHRPGLLGEKLTWVVERSARLFGAGGSFEFARQEMPSVAAQRVLAEAFPQSRSQSQLALIVATGADVLQTSDLKFADRLAQRMHDRHVVAGIARAQSLLAEAQSLADSSAPRDQERASDCRQQAEAEWQAALAAAEESLLLAEDSPATLHNRAIIHTALQNPTAAAADRALAWRLQPELSQQPDRYAPRAAPALPIVDVWTRHSEVVGEKLTSQDQQATLVIVHLSTEFMATENIHVNAIVRQDVADVRREMAEPAAGVASATPSTAAMAPWIGISGSAAVGGDMLSAAAETIRSTERLTVLLVVIILLLVYRSPLLVLVPLATIVVSLIVSLGVLAALTQLDLLPGMDWWQFKVFKTTRIFIVAILFGAGTDFCLFLISRYKEELAAGAGNDRAVGNALLGVSDALAASALTTICGLSMMLLADFGKFSHSGPAIALCLAITLLACLTLAPALLRVSGQALFWPFGAQHREWRIGAARHTVAEGIWSRVARLIVAYPGRILVVSTLLLMPAAWWGLSVEVTYDIQGELAADSPSRHGTALLQRHFPIGESGPLVVVAQQTDGRFGSAAGEAAIRQLTSALYVPGVVAVRSIADPFGDRLRPGTPPERRRFSLTRGADLRRLILKKHRLTEALFLTPVPRLEGDATRLEVVLADNPFSREAADTALRIAERLEQIGGAEDSFWHGTQFSYAGATAAIRDLQEATRADNARIEVLVVLAVLAVLLVILRRPLISIYLVASVLFSYFVALGITEQFFRLAYGDTFQGLDWKVPLFLFVILVAIGQDYNIYLVTRVFEEQQRHGPIAGLRRAITSTGGIITSCGLIMAGTFVSMTAGSLRGIVELGFALSLGVMLDTFVVRPVIVPAYLALLARYGYRPRPLAASSGEKAAIDAKSPHPAR